MTEHRPNRQAPRRGWGERHRPHQERAEAVLRALCGEELVDVEVAAPKVPSAIDVVVRRPDRTLDAWGPLRERVRGRTLVVEHFSRPPSRDELSKAFAKACWTIADWSEDGAPETRSPLLVVLSVGRPRGALELWRGLEPTGLTGIYAATLTPLEAVLVDVKALPPGPGTSVLRFFDHRPDVAEDNVRRLWTDPAVGNITKDALRRAIMSDPKTFERERPLTLEEVEERAEKRAEERAEKRVEARDRDALLDQARRRLAPDQVAELEAIDDFRAFAARLVELLAGDR